MARRRERGREGRGMEEGWEKMDILVDSKTIEHRHNFKSDHKNVVICVKVSPRFF